MKFIFFFHLLLFCYFLIIYCLIIFIFSNRTESSFLTRVEPQLSCIDTYQTEIIDDGGNLDVSTAKCSRYKLWLSFYTV